MRARILVVEDEPAIRLALTGLLRRDGHTVVEATSGPEALQRLESEAPELVLTDLALGEDVSGLDVLRETKVRHPATAVIMITAYGSERLARRAVAAGAEGYVPKPFDNRAILDAVQRALARVRGAPRGSEPVPGARGR